jgi:dTDP-D-glucose 4,6-dehydratase
MTKKNLLITGGIGMIGSNFINYIFKKNTYRIIALDNLESCLTEKAINADIRNSNDFTFVQGSFGDKKLVKKLLCSYKITHVLNLAATLFNPKFVNEPLYFVENNVNNTAIFLETCRKYGKLELYIHMSTYLIGDIVNGLFSSNEICIHPYSVTKASSLSLTVLYRDIYKLPVIIAMPNNVFAKNQCISAPVPDYLILLKNGEKIPLNINDSNKGNYIYIDNVVTAIEILFKKGVVGELYKILNDDEEGCLTNIELARKLIKDFNNTCDFNRYIEYINESSCKKQKCDTDNKALKDLGWEITVSTDKGLKIVSDHYKTLQIT